MPESGASSTFQTPAWPEIVHSKVILVTPAGHWASDR